MTTLTAPNGKRYETEDVPSQYDPLFCRRCGRRVGWIDDDMQGVPCYPTCEDCIADMQEEVL